MSNLLKKLPAPPVFDDETKNRTATVTSAVLSIATTGVLFLIVLSLIVRGTLLFLIPLLLWTLGILLVSYYPLYRGRVKLAAWLALIGLWSSITIGNVLWRGAYSPAPGGYMILILAGGVMLGRRAGLNISLVSIVLVLALGVLTQTGVLPVFTMADASITRALIYAMFYVLTAMVLYVTSRMVDDAFLRQRVNEQQMTETLNRLQSTTVSKNYFDNILRSMSDLLIVLEPDGRIRMVNPAALKLLGYTEAELVGQSIEKVLISRPLNLGNSEGETTRGNEAALRTAKGKEIPIAYSQSALRNEENLPAGIVLLAEDITERRTAEAERLRNAMRYRALFEQTNDAIFLISLEGKHIAVNQRSADMLGYTTSELIGKTALDIVSPKEQNNSNQVFQNLLAGKSIGAYERTFQRKDGTDIPVEISVELVRDADGKPMHVQSVVRDITDRKRTEQQLAYQASLLQNVNDAIISTDMRNTIQSWNRAAETVYGWKAEEVLGKKLSEIVPTEFASDSEDFIKQQYIVRGYWRSEVTQRARNGQKLMMLTSVSILRDNNGELIGTVSVNHDITARKRAEAELQEYVTQLAALRQVDVEINSSLQIEAVLQLALHAACLLSDAEAGFIALYDDGAMHLRQTYGLYETKKYPPGTETLQLKGIVDRAVRQRQPVLITSVTDDPDYVEDLAETRAQMVFPLISSDRLTGVINLETTRPENFTQDKFDFLWILTSRIAVALDNARLFKVSQDQLTELKNLYERVKRLEALKTDMIRIASHDLRNPVGVIKGYLEILRGDLADRLSVDEKEYMETIWRSVSRIQNIISDILSLERIEEVAQNTSGEVIDLPEMVKRLTGDSAAHAIRKHQRLEQEIAADQMLIQADSAQIREAIVNLIDNAIKYTPEGGEIEVRLCREKDTARFEVHDNGIGIPLDLQTRLFEPFYRARSPETLTIEGTGLGLHLVKNIIERHGGRMVVQSTYGEGSIFGFELPLIPGT